MAKGFLGSVKALGEGVDTRECGSVYWADVRGSMPDLVRAVGPALRMHPGEGRVASLVVPVLLGPGETADYMLASRAFRRVGEAPGGVQSRSVSAGVGPLRH